LNGKIYIIAMLIYFVSGSSCYNQDLQSQQSNEENDLSEVVIIANVQTTVFQRPGIKADIFGFLNSGDSVIGLARSSNGWVGFDPGIAQAANLGVFRLRWVNLDRSIKMIQGEFQDLPLVWTPLPGVCYNMFLNQSYLYSYPDIDSEIIDSFNPEDIAEILEFDSTGWVLIVSISEDTVNSFSGWIKPEDINFNGPVDDN
jgi:hypothetical protein